MTVLLRWIRRKGHNFEASLGYIVTFFLKKKRKEQTNARHKSIKSSKESIEKMLHL